MSEVEQRGLTGTKQIKGDIRQIEADGDHGVTYRLLFAVDGHASQMLLGLVAFSQKTQKTPDRAHRRGRGPPQGLEVPPQGVREKQVTRARIPAWP